ncbi:GSCOCG00000157001-RA-CDS, partial [Cotesia congregata]
NSWGNYTHFFQELANLSRDDKYNFDNNPHNTALNDSVESIGFLNEHIPPQDFGLVEVYTTTAHYPPSFHDPPPVSETSQEPNYEEYSCLENESWDAKSKQCTPTTLESVNTEETEEENSDVFHKLPVGQRST